MVRILPQRSAPEGRCGACLERAQDRILEKREKGRKEGDEGGRKVGDRERGGGREREGKKGEEILSIAREMSFSLNGSDSSAVRVV